MNEFLAVLSKTVLEIAAPVLAMLLTALLVKGVQKLGLTVDAERQAKLEYFAQQAVLRAEEWGASRIKGNPQAIMTASMKLERALTDLTDKIPGISRDEASELIHATLPKVGAGAAVFLQGVRKAATTGAQ